MGMLQGAPHPPTNGLQRFVTAGNLACCLGDQRLCALAQMNSCFCLAVTKDETLGLHRYLGLLVYVTFDTICLFIYISPGLCYPYQLYIAACVVIVHYNVAQLLHKNCIIPLY